MAVKYVSYELGEGAKRPYHKYGGDAGWDLYCSEEVTIQPGRTADVHTGVKIGMPRGLYARITGRSSSLRRHRLLVNEGIVDNGYTGEMYVCVTNVGTEPVTVRQGARVAQVLFHAIEDVRWSEVEQIGPSKDGRGDRGFGSTGE